MLKLFLVAACAMMAMGCAFDADEFGEDGVTVEEASLPVTKGQKIGDASFTVHLYFPNTDGRCSGVIVAENWILTAAHCLEDEYLTYGTYEAGRMYIRVQRLLSKPNIYGSATSLQPASVYLHPSYTGSADYDVGLVRLYGTGLSGTVGTDWMRARFWDDSRWPWDSSSSVWIAGYGDGSWESGGDDCSEADPLIDNPGRYEEFSWTGTKTSLYAQATSPYRTTCEGDSGGAWYVFRGSYYLTVASHVSSTQVHGGKSTGSMVRSKLQWIKNTAAGTSVPLTCTLHSTGGWYFTYCVN